MKKITFILAIGLVIVALGCKKENEDKGNHIAFDGEVYPLSWGLVVYSEYKGIHEYTIRLSPQSMYLEESSGLVKGDGTFMAFLVISSSQILEGSYSLPEEEVTEKAAGQIRFAAIVTWPSEDGYIFEMEGELVISSSGDVYEISFTGKEEGGLSIYAYYKGEISLYE